MAIDGNYDGKITIQKGQGISQAIRDELGLTQAECNKLGGSIWAKIFEQVEAQNQLGQIYQGGSDLKGPTNKNFVVNPNQEIEFSKDIWDNIVQLVNDKLGKNIEKLNPTSPPVESDPTAKDSNPPKALDSKFITANPEMAGKTIKDPDTGNEIHYNDEGYIDNVKNERGYTIFERHGDSISDYGLTTPLETEKNGLIVEYNLDGTVKSYKRFQYDERGETIEGTRFSYGPDGTPIE